MRLEKYIFCIKFETIGLVIGFFGVLICGCSLLFLVGVISYKLLDSSEQTQENDFFGKDK